jgi:hypothetical protein
VEGFQTGVIVGTVLTLPTKLGGGKIKPTKPTGWGPRDFNNPYSPPEYF